MTTPAFTFASRCSSRTTSPRAAPIASSKGYTKGRIDALHRVPAVLPRSRMMTTMRPPTPSSSSSPSSSVRASAAEESTSAVSSSTSSASQLAAELVAQVTSSSGPNDERVVQLIAQLEEANCAADEAAFVGAWEVVWSEGTMAWRALVAKAVQAVAGRSRAGQCFTLAASPPEALNFAELFAGAVTITAWGVFRPKPHCADDDDPEKLAPGAAYPLGFDVQIAGGDVRLGGRGGRRWELPICGPGEFNVLYGDSRVRVFRSSGGVAVQVPSDWKRFEE